MSAEAARSLRPVPALALLGLCVACATDTSLRELDLLARSTGARTVLLEQDLSLYSPFDPSATRAHLDQIRVQRDLVFGLLGLERGAPLCVWLRPDQGLQLELSVEGDRLHLDGLRDRPREGIYGRAWNDEVVLQVAPPQLIELPDGRSLEGQVGAAQYASTLRHELAHVATRRLGIHGQAWLDEGVAHLVEWVPIEDGRPRLDPPPAWLRQAARLGPEQRSVDHLLSWQQSLPVTDADRAARLLACSLVAFALERQPAPTLREGLLQLARADAAQLRSLEPDWCARLARIAATDP